MKTEQSRAERLAAEIHMEFGCRAFDAVDELLRLHSLNQELLEACCTIVKAFDALPQTDQARYSRLHINAARAAIAKAKEQE